jgi:hypothetical protein
MIYYKKKKQTEVKQPDNVKKEKTKMTNKKSVKIKK